MKKLFLTVTLVGLMLSSQSTVRAQAGGFALQRIKRSLSHYDLQNGTTTNALRELNEFVNVVTVEHEIRQARFMRAIALSDLVVIATITEREELIEKLAEVMNIDRIILLAFIEQELEDYGRGANRLAGQQAAAAIQIAERGFDPRANETKRASVLLRDLFGLDAIYKSIKRGKGLAEALEAYTTDPCALPKTNCLYPFSSFDAEGRKAAFALQQLGHALKRLQLAVKKGVPIARYFESYLKEISRALSDAELTPSPQIYQKLVAISKAARTSKTMPDAVIAVTESELRFGFVPKIKLTTEGSIRVITAGKPVLPEMSKVKLPTSYLPYIRQIDEVTRILKATLRHDTPVSVALGPGRDVPAHIIGRVLLSLRPLSVKEISMLGLGEDGSPHTVPMQVVSTREIDEMNPAQVNLRIRLGGYTLKLGLGSKQDIPRIKGETGFQFDLDTLAAKVGERGHRSAEVSFMGDVRSESLVAAMFRVAPDNDPVRLVIPQ
ncbi:MAG: hypothetical protein JXA30_01565 [Deltaproteobacteria bacterium]|nr:hypothetical protein [Deltaproteobacteria bacterium]